MEIIMKLLLLLLLFSNLAFADDKMSIQAKDFPNWPFKDAYYTLGCLEREGRKMVYIFNIDDTYGINGSGRGLGKNLFEWKDGESQLKKGKRPIALQPFIEKGVKLCN